MRKLNKPTENTSVVFLECISIVKNVDLKAKLTACKDLIINGANEFEKHVTKGTLHTIVRETLVNGNVSAKELENIYTFRMAKKNTPGRKIYDKIKMAAPLGVCPLCSHREVTTIDHYLPKSEYPRLSVVPINLVPSCSDCNKSKLSGYPTAPNEESLHPYYDDIENELWLSAEVIHTKPPSIKFNVVYVSIWSELLNERVEYHFYSLNLDKLYTTQAAVELSQINFRLERLLSQKGPNEVRAYLLDGVETRSHANKNSWQAAMYTAIANDDWFCNGGFKL